MVRIVIKDVTEKKSQGHFGHVNFKVICSPFQLLDRRTGEAQCEQLVDFPV